MKIHLKMAPPPLHESARPAMRPQLPPWLKIRLGGGDDFVHVKGLLHDQKLNTVCRSAKCPNLGECWSRGTATFMILGDDCTRQCPFCAIGHARPQPPDPGEPRRLAEAARDMKLKWVVVTSVNRDDLKDGGANHFASVVSELRAILPDTGIELLVPDFRKKQGAREIIAAAAPDVLNHNVENVPRLYKTVRPGADYQGSLDLLAYFAGEGLITKSGMFVGVGETMDEVKGVISDLRRHQVRSLTIGQYLQATRDNLPVLKFYHPDEFKELSDYAYATGFDHVAAGPFVRSSYHAEEALQIYGMLKERYATDHAV